MKWNIVWHFQLPPFNFPQVSHVEVRMKQKRVRRRKHKSNLNKWRIQSLQQVAFFFFFFFFVFFFLIFETKPSTFDRFHGGWSFNNGDKVLWACKIPFLYKVKIVPFFFVEQILCHPSLIELLFSKMI